MHLGRFILRTTVGGLFIGHGTQKLFGWFEGHGLEATASGFDSMGMRPGKANAIAAGAAEAGGGAALALGFATPLAGSVLTATMLTAIHRVHLKNGPWASKGGYEYNLVLIAAVLALVETGPGDLSIDHLRGVDRSGAKWALAALAAGAAGAAAAHLLAEQNAAPASVPEPPVVAADPEPAAADAGTSNATPVQDADGTVDAAAHEEGSDAADAPAESES